MTQVLQRVARYVAKYYLIVVLAQFILGALVGGLMAVGVIDAASFGFIR